MRLLSEIHGDEAMQVLAILINIGRRVVRDKKIVSTFNDDKISNNEKGAIFFEILLSKYERDCMSMLAAVEGTELQEYKDNLTPKKLSADLGAVMNDSDFTSLFFEFAPNRSSGST